MSLQMQQARYAVGDPGLFGFIGKAIGTIGSIAGGILPGPAGLLGKAVGSVLAPKSVKQATAARYTQPMFPQSLPVSRPALPGGVQIGGASGVQIGTFAPQGVGPGGTAAASTGPLVGQPAQNGKPCASGYHWNKTGYWTKKYGYIAKGTVCVRNRRRNPLNPRALSRSMARLKSAQQAVKCMGLFAGAPARAAAKSKPKRRSCGKGCK